MQINILGTNQCEVIFADNCAYFQSYKSVIAKKFDGKITLYKDWDYSRTTMKHLSRWLGISCKDIRKKIKTGEIVLEKDKPMI